jgi:uncharacterized membrane protein YqjE
MTMTAAKFERSREALVKDFTDVLAEAESLLKQAAKESGEKANDLRGQVEAKLRSAKIRLNDLSDDASERAKAAAKVTDDYVRDNPWQANARPAAGLASALSQLAATALAMVRTRLELATVEFTEERERAKEMLLLLFSTVLVVLFALLFASIFVIAYFWDSYRLTAVGAVTGFYLVLAVIFLVRLKQRMDEKHSPFTATLSQLEEDAEALRRKP